MYFNTNSLDINPDTNLNSPQLAITPQLSYFDTITQRLDSWQAKQLAIREAKAQLTKAFLLQDVDEITGEIRVYKISTTLICTLANSPYQEAEMEVVDYAN